MIQPNPPSRTRAPHLKLLGASPKTDPRVPWWLGVSGYYRPERRHLLQRVRALQTDIPVQQRLLAWLRDNVHHEIPRRYYEILLGHDVHTSTRAELYVRHYHANSPDPRDPEVRGFWEDVGRVSTGKVTNAFRDFECAQLVAESSLYGDFKFHEVGTAATAEANTQTALTTTTGIARSTGNQTNPSASTYQTVATVLSDTAETWQEHGLFNASTSGTMLDRSLISPTVAVAVSDTVEFTYVLSKSSES